MKTYRHISELVDQLGKLRAEQRMLRDDANRIESEIINAMRENSMRVAEGRVFRVAVSFDMETKRVDWKTVAAKLDPSRQLVTAHTKTTVGDRVRVTAHKKGE